MNIQEAIKQKAPFRSHHEKALVNVFYTNNYLSESIATFLRPYNITHQQFNVLRILRGQYPKGITVADIRERMLDRASDASRVIDRLVKKDLVEKDYHPSDKRLLDVRITLQGLHLLAETDTHIGALDVIMRGLTSEEAEQLSILLDKVRIELPQP